MQRTMEQVWSDLHRAEHERLTPSQVDALCDDAKEILAQATATAEAAKPAPYHRVAA